MLRLNIRTTRAPMAAGIRMVLAIAVVICPFFMSPNSKRVALCFSIRLLSGYSTSTSSQLTADIHVHEFFKTSYFKKGIHPLPCVHKTLHKLSRYCELSRQNAIKEHTLEWIEIHFPGLFKEIHFGNHFALHGESRPKSEICRSFGAEILIDDNPIYAEECADIAMKFLLFDYENSYPWAKTESVDKHLLVTRVHNWEEVEPQILSLVVSKC